MCPSPLLTGAVALPDSAVAIPGARGVRGTRGAIGVPRRVSLCEGFSRVLRVHVALRTPEKRSHESALQDLVAEVVRSPSPTPVTMLSPSASVAPAPRDLRGLCSAMAGGTLSVELLMKIQWFS